MWSPEYYRNSILAGNQRFFRTSGEEYLYGLPLFVIDCGLTRWESGSFCDRRKSELFSVELVTAGDALFTQNKRQYVVRPGEVFLVHKGKDQHFAPGPSGYLHKRMIIMDGIMLDMTLRSLGLTEVDVLAVQKPAVLIGLIKMANRAIGIGEPDTPWVLSQLGYRVLLELGQNVAQKRIPSEVTRALRFMDANLQKNLTLAQVAAQTGISMYHFSRVFHKALNLPPMAFFTRQKMEFAKTLLTDSSMLIKEIAAVLGYEDPFYFTAQFKKHAGVSPREYRQKM